ncbi:BrnT family toxin [Xanthobacter versatilis]|uniref:BrnT family toxin n=1 Tax=Xanthobacter autotrophicus (strain ATCC BAA-1158 / Py2) TaxID=78245 RepID=UPI0037294CC6
MGETDDLEWDDDKDAANRVKHGLPLSIAGRLFDGRQRLDRQSIKPPQTELRFETFAAIGEDVVFCVWTWRCGKRRAYQEAIGGS